MKIICECGYPLDAHGYMVEGGMMRSNIPCKLLKETVEARHWARVMATRYFARVMWCEELAKERNKFKKELEQITYERDIYYLALHTDQRVAEIKNALLDKR